MAREKTQIHLDLLQKEAGPGMALIEVTFNSLFTLVRGLTLS